MEKLPGQPRDVAVSDSNIVFIACGSSICMYREQQGILVTHPLAYETTSVAVAPSGTQIAIGGKVTDHNYCRLSVIRCQLSRIIKHIFTMLMVQH
jgi:hypothetical protein